MIFCAINKKYHRNDLNISVDGQNIEQVNKTKFLGVYIDDKLNWREHVNYTAGKIARNIGIIARAKKFVTKKLLLVYTILLFTLI